MKRLLTILIAFALLACPAFAAGVASAEGAALAADKTPTKAPPKPETIEQQLRELKAYIALLLSAISRLDKRIDSLEGKLAALQPPGTQKPSAKKGKSAAETAADVAQDRRIGMAALRQEDTERRERERAIRRAFFGSGHGIGAFPREVWQWINDGEGPPPFDALNDLPD